jgi:hypothetical protein
MVSRRSLGLLAGTTLVLAALAGAIGEHHVVGKVAFFGFLACALFLIVASVATLVRHRGRLRRS